MDDNDYTGLDLNNWNRSQPESLLDQLLMEMDPDSYWKIRRDRGLYNDTFLTPGPSRIPQDTRWKGMLPPPNNRMPYHPESMNMPDWKKKYMMHYLRRKLYGRT